MELMCSNQEMDTSIRSCLNQEAYDLHLRMKKGFEDSFNNLKALGRQILGHHNFLLRELLEIEKSKKEDCQSEKKRNRHGQRTQTITVSPSHDTSLSDFDSQYPLVSRGLKKKEATNCQSKKKRNKDQQRDNQTINSLSPSRDASLFEHTSPDPLANSGSQKRKAANPRRRLSMEGLEKPKTTSDVKLDQDLKMKEAEVESQTTHTPQIKRTQEAVESEASHKYPRNGVPSSDNASLALAADSKQMPPIDHLGWGLLSVKKRLLIRACQNFSLSIERLRPEVLKSLHKGNKCEISEEELSSDGSWDNRVFFSSPTRKRKRRRVKSTSESSNTSMEIPLQNDNDWTGTRTPWSKAKQSDLSSSDEETSVTETPQKKPKRSVPDKLGLASCSNKLFPNSPSTAGRKRSLRKRPVASPTHGTEQVTALIESEDPMTPPPKNLTRSKRARFDNDQKNQTSQSDNTAGLHSSPVRRSNQQAQDTEGMWFSPGFTTVLDKIRDEIVSKRRSGRKQSVSSPKGKEAVASTSLDSCAGSKQFILDSETGHSTLPDGIVPIPSQPPPTSHSSVSLTTGCLSDKTSLAVVPPIISESLGKRRSPRIISLRASDSEVTFTSARTPVPYPLRTRLPQESTVSSSRVCEVSSSPLREATVITSNNEKPETTVIQTNRPIQKENPSEISHPESPPCPSPSTAVATSTPNRMPTRSDPSPSQSLEKLESALKEPTGRRATHPTNKEVEGKDLSNLRSQLKVNKEERDSPSLEDEDTPVSKEDSTYSPSTDRTSLSSLVSEQERIAQKQKDQKASKPLKRSTRRGTLGLPLNDETMSTQQLDGTLLPGSTSVMSLRSHKPPKCRPSYLASRLSMLEESRVEKSICGGKRKLVSSQLGTSSILIGLEDKSSDWSRRKKAQHMKLNTRYFTTPKLKNQNHKNH